MDRVKTIILALVGVAILVGLAFWANAFKPAQPTSDQPNFQPCPSNGTVAGSSFIVPCPSGMVYTTMNVLGPDQQMLEMIGFNTAAGEPWAINITATDTSFSSTEAWLASQPQGSTSQAGVHFLKWFTTDSSDRFAVYVEYSQIDTDGNRPIYGAANAGASFVSDGKLYTILGRLDLPALQPASDFYEFIKGFRLKTT